MIFLQLLPHLFLFFAPDLWAAAGSIFIYLICCILVIRFDDRKRSCQNIHFPLLTFFFSLLFGTLFYLRWHDASLFTALESLPQMPAKRVCGIFAAFLAVFSIWGTDVILSLVVSRILKKDPVPKQPNDIAYLGLTSFSVITLLSRCSPFYAFNDWVDPHTMFTVGKSILRGMMPYRDVFEQKGPLLLLLHAFGALVSFDSFIGIWLLEILFCFLFLFISWHLLRIHLGNRALPLMPVLALIVYTALSFEQGDSAEEFCLPLLAYGLLVGYRSMRSRTLPTVREWILIGVTSGVVLWIKYSMLGFYLGWILAVFLFAKSVHRGTDVLRGIGWITAGVGAVTLPILIWFACAGALPQLFEVYFYDNMFLYPNTADMYGNFALHRNLGNGLLNFIVFSTFIFVFSVLGLIRTGKNEEKQVFRLVLYSFWGLFLFIYFSGRFYSYYSLIFGICVPLGLLWLYEQLNRIPVISRSWHSFPGMWSTLVPVVCIVALFFCSGNMSSLQFEKEDYPQYRAKELIEASGVTEPTLLNYHFLDMGVNQIAGILPNQRFFCGFNLPLPAIRQEQNACLAGGCTDFVLTFMLEIDSEKYELLERIPSNYSIGPVHPTYNLYQRKQ